MLQPTPRSAFQTFHSLHKIIRNLYLFGSSGLTQAQIRLLLYLGDCSRGIFLGTELIEYLGITGTTMRQYFRVMINTGHLIRSSRNNYELTQEGRDLIKYIWKEYRYRQAAPFRWK